MAAQQHTICGYGWGDVGSALVKAIGKGNSLHAQRWAAEMVCTETGLGRLEAQLLHAWAIHVGPANAPGWPRAWIRNIQHIRAIWAKSGGDISTVRNTPSIRQMVAEVVEWLVLAPKRAFPVLPKPEDCFREAEAMRSRLRSGGGSGDQIAVRRIWSAGNDGHDLKTIGNELEAALRTGQVQRMLFWCVWMITLDSQKECPSVKERAPPDVTGKQRKSVLWFLWALLRDLTEEFRAVIPEEREALFDLIAVTWNKLGARGRKDVLAIIALFLQEKCCTAASLIEKPVPPEPTDGMKAAAASVDRIYAEIAQEARRFTVETPRITQLTCDAAAQSTAPKNTLNSLEKLNLAYSLLHHQSGKKDGI
jgi:hypothetical protein